ncbi:STAS domain-containing protein [Amycolatopsis sp. 195334CR]|uniref:STAS domain-containing protein n=1 Tax=Amycolatopsis sp. 195334CR TaxID=2814588 RepID=UPI001A8C04DF|nr:STAS domain-containing protein [Amycolatopsis sp. 195334CR]MBN6040519.1 STAS domain-containing protein [Amycolatopsis sp. 195334CR]
MTTVSLNTLTCTWSTPEERTAVLRLDGDLDYSCSTEFAELIRTRLAGTPDLRTLRLDCGALGLCDSGGLSALLMIRRHTEAAGVVLHLDHRGAALERLLEVTGTRHYLTGERTVASVEQEQRGDS